MWGMEKTSDRRRVFVNEFGGEGSIRKNEVMTTIGLTWSGRCNEAGSGNGSCSGVKVRGKEGRIKFEKKNLKALNKLLEKPPVCRSSTSTKECDGTTFHWRHQA